MIELEIFDTATANVQVEVGGRDYLIAGTQPEIVELPDPTEVADIEP